MNDKLMGGYMKIDLQQLLRYVPFLVGYLVAFYYKKRYDEKKIEDLYLFVLISGLVGARLTYAVFNVGIFNYDWSSVISISRYNLNLIGGLVISLIVLYLLCKKYNLDIQKYLKYYAIILFTIFLFSSLVEVYLIHQFPFYLSMTSQYELWLSAALFIAAIFIEVLLPEKYRIKYFTPILIVCVLLVKELIGFFI